MPVASSVIFSGSRHIVAWIRLIEEDKRLPEPTGMTHEYKTVADRYRQRS